MHAGADPSHAMDVVVSVVGPSGAQVPPTTPGSNPTATPTPLTPATSDGLPQSSSFQGQNDPEGESGAEKEAGPKLKIAAVSAVNSDIGKGSKKAPLCSKHSGQVAVVKKGPFGALLCCFAPSKTVLD